MYKIIHLVLQGLYALAQALRLPPLPPGDCHQTREREDGGKAFLRGNPRDAAQALAGKFKTHVFCANSCPETNEFASRIDWQGGHAARQLQRGQLAKH